MPHSYFARTVMNDTLISSATGGSPNPKINTGVTFQDRLGVWTGGATKNTVYKNTAETVNDILDLGGLEEFKACGTTFRDRLVDHILAAEMVVDDLARTSAGKLKAFGRILGSVNELYKNHTLWSQDIAPFQTVITAVLDSLVLRCREAKKRYNDRKSRNSICYIDLQHDLERAFVMNLFTLCPSEQVRNLPTVFCWLYQDCCDSLWHEELKEREKTAEKAVEDGDDCYDEDEDKWGPGECVRDCGCGRSMLRNMVALRDEGHWIRTERKMWSRRFPTRGLPKNKRKSPLRLYEESCDYGYSKEDCQDDVVVSPGEEQPEKLIVGTLLNISSDEDMNITENSYDSYKSRQLDYC